MTEEKKADGKQRIFDAAVELFAMKGYDAVGTREIANLADVNISMINYYYDGKVGILKAIVDESSRRYYSAIIDAGADDMEPRERMRRTIHNMVRFFRENTAMSIVMSNTFNYEVPEIVELRLQWIAQNRARLDTHFARLGLDIKDHIQMSVFRGLLTVIIQQHFQSMFIYERNKKMYDDAEKKYFQGEVNDRPEECCAPPDDDFYRKYADTLTDFYLFGVTGLADKKGKKGD